MGTQVSTYGKKMSSPSYANNPQSGARKKELELKMSERNIIEWKTDKDFRQISKAINRFENRLSFDQKHYDKVN